MWAVEKVKSGDLHGRPKLKIPDVITFDVNFDIKQFLGKLKADTKAANTAANAADKAKSETAATDATTASTAASVFSTANSDNITMYKAVSKVSDNLGDGVINKVKCSISTGNITFNGEPLDAGNKKNSPTSARPF